MLHITDNVSATLADVLAAMPHEGIFILADEAADKRDKHTHYADCIRIIFR